MNPRALEADQPDSSVRILPFEGSPEEWDDWVAGDDSSTFCHLHGWRQVMSEVFGHESIYRVARNGKGVMLGILPMVHVHSRAFGDFLVSMPFLSYGGPLGSPAVRELLARDAIQTARDLNVDLLELRDRIPVPGPLQSTHRKLTVLLDLPRDAETLWKEGLKGKVRSQVRRPKKEGMVAQVGAHLLEDFYGVFARTMRDLGTPVLPMAFFRAAATHLGPQIFFCVVTMDGKPVAGGCGFHWKGEVEVTWAGALREYSREAPNMLLYWSMMEWAIGEKASSFNFGRCTDGSGTHRFKRQWGGRDHPLPWAQWSPRGLTSTPMPVGAKYRLATALWRRLPVPVSNALGPWVSRSLP